MTHYLTLNTVQLKSLHDTICISNQQTNKRKNEMYSFSTLHEKMIFGLIGLASIALFTGFCFGVYALFGVTGLVITAILSVADIAMRAEK